MMESMKAWASAESVPEAEVAVAVAAHDVLLAVDDEGGTVADRVLERAASTTDAGRVKAAAAAGRARRAGQAKNLIVPYFDEK